jgi:uncharacterized membrane protein
MRQQKGIIRWRSNEPSRLETFSDAVFAFALTLIIVSIEVPKSFDELVEPMKGTLSFAVCFAILFQIWNNQNLFFRRYALKNTYIMILNAILLFVVLIYSYPLKFLSMLLFSFSDGKYVQNGHEFMMIRDSQVQPLMIVYGAGFFVIYGLFYLMYKHVDQHKVDLELSSAELFVTKSLTGINLICMCICLTAMLLAGIFPAAAGPSGFTYCLIPVAYTVWFKYRAVKLKQLFERELES